MAEQYCRGRYDFAKLNLNLNFKLVLFSVDTTTYTHPLTGKVVKWNKTTSISI